MRDILVTRLKQDLVGPYAETEVLQSRPSDVYLSGILWPRETRVAEEEDEKLGLAAGGDNAGEGDAEEEEVPLAGLKRPSSAGISFAVTVHEATPAITVEISFATYEPKAPEQSEKNPAAVAWHRKPHRILLNDVRLDRHVLTMDLESHGAPRGVKLHLRQIAWARGLLVTVTLVNMAQPEADAGRNDTEALTLFQTAIEVRPAPGTQLIARPSRRVVLDEDDRAAALLYRDALEFAVGHTCSACWEAEHGATTAHVIGTEWVPTALVPATSAAGHPILHALTKNAQLKPLSADWLVSTPDDNLRDALALLPDLYRQWIAQQQRRIPTLPPEHQAQATINLAECSRIADRIADGAAAIATDPVLRASFRLANLAMATQYAWSGRAGSLHWRPFQLAFLLLTARSTVERGRPDRDVMDLLWFPTGGGKTEAYLALVAFLLFHRRLREDGTPDAGAGVAAIMRYTLRLLTTQQFGRAASLVLACEAIRRGKVQSHLPPGKLGNHSFSIKL
jgi:hypothetical protein